MHTYEENPFMYIYLCSNALETELKMISIYVAHRFLAELLRFMGDIKAIKKKKRKRISNGKMNLPQTEQDVIQTSFLSTKIMGTSQF